MWDFSGDEWVFFCTASIVGACGTVLWYLNPEYSMKLFTDPMGHQMLAGAVILQILGALVIRKIVNIKV